MRFVNVGSLFTKNKNKKKKSTISKNDPPSFGSSNSASASSFSSASPRTVLGHHKILKRELELALQRLDLDREEILDLEGLGAIVDADGFVELSDGGVEELREAFGVFDRDGDGKISAEELRGVLVILGEGEGCGIEECRRMIEGVDSDGDGFVCFNDFVRMMR